MSVDYAEGEIIQVGTVPCKKCGAPHHLRFRDPYPSWEAEDGHAYYQMSAAEVVATVLAALGIAVPSAEDEAVSPTIGTAA